MPDSEDMETTGISNATAATPEIFAYDALTSESSFRVLELLPGAIDDPIAYRLHLADLNEPPNYEALSYVWGQSVDSEHTVCNGKRHSIRSNLHRALHQFRRESCSRTLWVDAICINQNCTPERNQQVSKMMLIYHSAERVLVWLGFDDDDQAAIAFDAIRAVNQKTLSAAPSPPLPVENERKQSRQWRSLKWLLSRPWFSRVWVVQEAINNPQVIVHCGAQTIPWKSLTATVNHICAFDHDEVFHTYGFIHSEIWSARVMIILEQSHPYRDNDGRLGLLHFLRRFHATDPRDKVYAVLGTNAFQETVDTATGPKENTWIEADYYKSTADVYRTVAEKVIFSEPRNLTALSYVLPGSETRSSFSSWAPRWDQPDSAHILLRYIQGRNPTTNCSRGMPIFIRRSEEPHVLEVSGVEVDAIMNSTEISNDTRFSSQMHGMKTAPFLEFWRAINNNHSAYLTGDDMEYVMSMVFTGGKNDSAAITEEQHRSDFEEWLAKLQKVYHDPEVLHNANTFTSAITGQSSVWAKQAQDHTWGRAFIETKNGYMGIGPKSAQKNDLLCVLGGSQVPFVLRRVEINRYRLVGECYVHGIMNGEIVKAKEGDDLKTFYIE